MKRTLLLIALFSAIVAFSSIKLKEHEKLKEARFQEFMTTHNKQYKDDAEYKLRKTNFEASVLRASQRNRRSKGKTQFGITKFSDLSTQEFKNLYLTASVPARQRLPGVPVMKPTVDVKDMPESLDYRKKGLVTPVKDQGQCGSCWAFSVTENIESKWIMAGKAKANDLSLSVQQIVDCDDVDAGCNGGEPGSAYDYVIAAGGLQTNSSYPYTATGQTCAFEKNETVVQIKSWQYATSWYSETELQQNLVSWGPLSICVDAASWQDYKSGVLTWEECAWVNLLDHCVQLVGYGNDAKAGKYWIVRNSWGTSWGIDGYIHLQMGDDTCGIAHQASSAFV